MCKLATTLNVVIVIRGFRNTVRHVFLCKCLAMGMPDLRRKYVSSVVNLALLLKWLHPTEIKNLPSHTVSFLAGKY